MKKTFIRAVEDSMGYGEMCVIANIAPDNESVEVQTFAAGIGRLLSEGWEIVSSGETGGASSKCWVHLVKTE